MNQFFTILLALGHGIAALAVTAHVLLTHRDVRSSIGWIGLAWLSPFVGSAIYLAFGINRVAQRGSEIQLVWNGKQQSISTAAETVLDTPTGANIVSIARTGDNISTMPLTSGNALKVLCNGDVAYPAMLNAIAQAKSSIALSVYIFSSDTIGNKFADRLIAAHKRGVEVRILVDGIGSGYFRAPIVKKLRKAGIKTGQFLHEWAPWSMAFINLRNHKKLLIVDGTIGFTGGMNISDDNLSHDAPPKIQDVHARLDGPIVHQLMLTFARDWEFTTDETLEGDIWWPEVPPAGDITMRGIASGPDDSVGNLETLLAAAIEQAEQRVRIVTPYFLPEDALFEVIRRASLRGVTVEIIMPEKTNHFYFNWAIAAHLATFPLEGISCYLAPAPFDHSKLMSVDGKWASFGSANWDARSMRLNFEFQIACYSEEAAKTIDALIDDKKKGAKLATTQMFDDRPTITKLRDASVRLFLPYL